MITCRDARGKGEVAPKDISNLPIGTTFMGRVAGIIGHDGPWLKITEHVIVTIAPPHFHITTAAARFVTDYKEVALYVEIRNK